MSSIQDDLAWAKSVAEDGLGEEAQEALENEFLEAVNALEDSDLTEEQAEERFRDMVRSLQTNAYLAGYAMAARVSKSEGPESVVAVINMTDATEIIKSLVSNQEIPLTIRVITD